MENIKAKKSENMKTQIKIKNSKKKNKIPLNEARSIKFGFKLKIRGRFLNFKT